MRKELIHTLDRFPEYRTKIQGLYQLNEDFRSLCEDYFLCREQLQKIKTQNLSGKLTQIECQQLCLDLEKELINYIGSCS